MTHLNLLIDETDNPINVLFFGLLILAAILVAIAIAFVILRKFPLLNFLVWLGVAIAYIVVSFRWTDKEVFYGVAALLYANFLALNAPTVLDETESTIEYDSVDKVEESFTTKYVYSSHKKETVTTTSFWPVTVGGFLGVMVIEAILYELCKDQYALINGIAGCLSLAKWLYDLVKVIIEKRRK